VPTSLTPGVWFERVDQAAPIAELRTDVAAFVGTAERGPVHTPVPVTSWEQFEAVFGAFLATSYLAWSVKAFFDNGGRRCHVVRVASPTAAPAAAMVRDANGTPALLVEAGSPGAWGNDLEARLVSSSPAATTTVGAQPDDRGRSLVESVTGFARGSLVRCFQPGAPNPLPLRLVEAVDPQQGALVWDQPLGAGIDLERPLLLETIEVAVGILRRGRLAEQLPRLQLTPTARPPGPVLASGQLARVLLHPAASPRDQLEYFHDPDAAELFFTPAWPVAERPRTARLAGGRDGLDDLTRADFTGDRGSAELRGLRVLEPVDEVSMVAVPDILVRAAAPPATSPLPPPERDRCLPGTEEPPPAPPVAPPGELPPVFGEADVIAVQRALVAHCEDQRDRIALLDPPLGNSGVLDVGRIQAWRARFDSSYAAMYYPWVLVYGPTRTGLVRAVPPSGHVAGIYARTDLAAGVHRPPANQELDWAAGVSAEVGDELQGLLDPAGVNCIRAFPGRGIRVYGARTLSSDPAWRWVNVRRLLLAIEEAAEEALQWTVFEGNDFVLRQLVTVALTGLLERLWERGALAGATAQEAFFVKCDEDNNPAAVVDAGALIAEVGVAPVKPAEFIVFRIGRAEGELRVEPAGGQR
jgi:phage tail sheath protein FI